MSSFVIALWLSDCKFCLLSYDRINLSLGQNSTLYLLYFAQSSLLQKSFRSSPNQMDLFLSSMSRYSGAEHCCSPALSAAVWTSVEHQRRGCCIALSVFCSVLLASQKPHLQMRSPVSRRGPEFLNRRITALCICFSQAPTCWNKAFPMTASLGDGCCLLSAGGKLGWKDLVFKNRFWASLTLVSPSSLVPRRQLHVMGKNKEITGVFLSYKCNQQIEEFGVPK